jgi:signal transduction histidine kinase
MREGVSRWLLLVLPAAALIGVAVLLWSVSNSISAQLKTQLATARVHVERLQELERAASAVHVVAVERWISDNTRRAEREAQMLEGVRGLRASVDALGEIEPFDEDERAAASRLMAAATLMSNQIVQALFAADIVGTTNDLQQSIDTVRAHATATTASVQRAGSSSDRHLVQLGRQQVVIQIVFVSTALVILAVAISMALRQVRAAEELRRVQAEGANQRARFFANMSHELRTPLVAIRGFATMISGATVPGEVVDGAHAIESQAHDLLGMINNILDASKLEAGAMQLSLEDVDLQQLVDRCLQRCRALIGAKPIELAQEVPPGLSVRADFVKLQQVLVNLIANGIKFTDRGFVRVRGRATSSDVEILVEDSGIGIAAEALERIWIPFQQESGATDRKYGGTGLGLSIVKGLVEKMDGSVRVTSEPGRGASFIVVLRRAVAPPLEQAS